MHIPRGHGAPPCQGTGETLKLQGQYDGRGTIFSWPAMLRTRAASGKEAQDPHLAVTYDARCPVLRERGGLEILFTCEPDGVSRTGDIWDSI